MDNKPKTKNLPIDIIIASFRGSLTQSEEKNLQEWLSIEDNRKKYDALKRVWNHTVANSGIFDSRKGYGSLRRRIFNIWKTVAITTSAAAVAAICFVVYNLITDQTDPVLTQTYACVTGKSSVLLPDGSNVVLHKGSSLIYDNSFSKTNRTVKLDGEAYFEVEKDPENTFTVSVDNVDITVYGTTFNVLENNESVIVSLIDGSVDVMTGAGAICALKPGQAAVYDKGTGSLVGKKYDVDFAACWAQDRLTFTQASLGEVCRYLSKWYDVEIIVPDTLESSCSYTFTIREEPIDQILDIMSRINPMKYLYTNDHRIIISEIL